MLINDNVVISSGRFRAWKYLVESAFKTNSAILGAGVGSSRPLLRQYVKYQSMQVAHGDYAKYLAEAGYAGLSLYLLFFLYYILYSFRQSYEWQSKNKYISRLYFMVFCGFIYFLITSMAYEQFNKVGFVSFLMLLLIFAEKNKEEFNVSKKI